MDLNATIKELDEMSKGLQQDIEEKDRKILRLNDENLALIKDVEYFKNQIENLKSLDKNQKTKIKELLEEVNYLNKEQKKERDALRAEN